jgi:proteasome alpha subunit
MYTPYDWQQNLTHRSQYVEHRIASGSPVVGISCPKGVILATTRTTARKIFEIYDRLIFGGIGSQADLETLRISATDFAHSEGFTRSEDDVTVQRVVGFALSPALKRAFADPMTTPFVAKALFAEIGDKQADDKFYVLNCEGEYHAHEGHAIIAGSAAAEEAADAVLAKRDKGKSLEHAAASALIAWGAAKHAQEELRDYSDEDEALKRLNQELEGASVEIGWLERETQRQSKFSLWPAERIDAAVKMLK